MSQDPASLTEELTARIRTLLADGRAPIVVGIDGRSGAGKSTLAAAVRSALSSSEDESIDVAVVEGDSFYAGGSAERWDRRTAQENADRVIDWRRQVEVLDQLRADGVASWHPFDWDSPDWDAEPVPLAPTPISVRLAPVVLLEGAYSCRPELHDRLDVRVLLSIPRDVRRQQLLARAGEEYRADWDERWSEAEDHYFGKVMTPDRFDLIVGR